MPDDEYRETQEPGAAAGGGGRPAFLAMTGARPGMVDRFLRRRPAADAFVELNNLLAEATDPREVSEDQVEAICRTYGIDVRSTFAARCRNLYREYLHWCLTDHRLSDDELACLVHLATILRLDSTTTAAIHRTVSRAVYLRSVEDVLEDGKVDEEERRFLARLSEHLEIPTGMAENILEMRRRQLEKQKTRRS